MAAPTSSSSVPPPRPSPLAFAVVREPADRAPHEAARHFLARLREPTTLLLALSGGSDSTALLIAFHEAMSAGSPHRLVACTVDHGLRQGSGAEAAQVAALCATLAIPHETARWQHAGVRSAIQAQARLARYRLLADCAGRHGAALILTGHTADDQAETIAMRRARTDAAEDGAATGLSGMADMTLFERRIWIARPFLRLSRQRLRDLLLQRGMSWIEDPSNDNPAFERVRLRRGGAAASVDLQQAEAAERRRRESSARIAALLAERLRFHGQGLGELSLLPNDLEDPDMPRLLAILAGIMGGRAHGPGRQSIDRLMTSLRASHARFAAGRCLFDRRGSRLFLYRELRGLPAEMQLPPGSVTDWDGRFRILNHTRAPLSIRTSCEAQANRDEISRSIPTSIARAAQSSLPLCLHDPLIAEMAPPISLSRRLAPFDTFLPCFDSTMAACFDSLIGREPFPPAPVRDDLS
ncbi:tRNA lysidine(34) synthetase TilS [Rhizobium sp. YIM 134829]|uniref:tRNA lysidine(34) synthetase TilS n=1 Tax=Rhizobium sp. YIM 134829 TaxID=3390453 RepID=UPI00397E1DA3